MPTARSALRSRGRTFRLCPAAASPSGILDVLGFDVDVIKQTLVHRVIAACNSFRRDREEFVEAEYDYVGENWAPLFYAVRPARRNRPTGDFPVVMPSTHISPVDCFSRMQPAIPRASTWLLSLFLSNVRVDFPFLMMSAGSASAPALLFRQFVISFQHLIL